MAGERLADRPLPLEAGLQEVGCDGRAREPFVVRRPVDGDRAQDSLVGRRVRLLGESLDVLAVAGGAATGEAGGEGYSERSEVHWPIRKMTNSAGLTSATPT